MKLDLRKTRAATVVDAFDDDLFSYDEDKPSFLSKLDIDPKKIISFFVRVALCVGGTAVLMYIEKQNLERLNGQKAVVQGEFDNLKSKSSMIEKEIKGFEYMIAKSRDFNNKLKIMQKIVDHRLSAVTGLDNIQQVIPKEVWLKKVDFNDRKFTLKGISTTNKQIQNFIEELERTNLFSIVSLQKSEEEKNNKNYRRRRFTIVSTLK